MHKSAIQFHLQLFFQVALIFYGVMISIALLGGTVSFIASPDNTSTSFFNGSEASSALFCFILGLCAFKSRFVFLLSNSQTRKSYFTSLFIAVLAFALSIALIDSILHLVSNLFGPSNFLVQEVYSIQFARLNGTMRLISFLGYQTALCAFSLMLGHVIAMLYYRLNPLGRWLISLAPPALLLFFLYHLSSQPNSLAWKFLEAISAFLTTIMGLNGSQNIWLFVLTFLTFFAIVSGFGFLLIRRASLAK